MELRIGRAGMSSGRLARSGAFPNRSHMSPSGAILMECQCANLANVVIRDRVVLHSAALADPEFESENGIGDFLDHAGAVSVVANAMEINAHGPADVCL